jgi:hypothetical protein
LTAAVLTRDLVGPGAQHAAGVVDRADAAADGERDEDLLGGVPTTSTMVSRASLSWR